MPRLLQRLEEHWEDSVVPLDVAVGALTEKFEKKMNEIRKIFSLAYHHRKVVDFDSVNHNKDKDMNKHNRQ